jgi:hypothetical protein
MGDYFEDKKTGKHVKLSSNGIISHHNY